MSNPSTTQALALGSIISRIFAIISANFGHFFLLIMIAILPETVIELAGGSESVATAVGLFPKVIVEGILVVWVYRHLTGQAVTLRSASAPALSRVFTLVGIRILMTLAFVVAILVGMLPILLARLLMDPSPKNLLFIIPSTLLIAGFVSFLSTCWSVTVPIAIVEQKNTIECFKRSANLTKGRRAIILALYVLTLVIAGTLVAALNFAVGLIASFFGLKEVIEVIGSNTAVGLISGALSIGGAVIYYDLRSIKEGIHLDNLVGLFD